MDEKQFKELNDNVKKLAVIIGLSQEFDDRKVKKLAKAGFTQPEIEKVTGIDQGDISRVLKGKKRGGK
jgi:transcriptional regulator with XRE-family HTH domain